MKISKFKIFESANFWNDIFTKINDGDIPKSELDVNAINKIKKLIPKNSNVLDISVGDGTNAEYFINNNFNVFGTDISNVAINNLESKYPNHTWIIHDTLDKFPFKNNFFELVFARLALHYFNNNEIEKILIDIDRILKNDGYLYILVKCSNVEKIDSNKIIHNKNVWIDIVSNIFNIVEKNEKSETTYDANDKSILLEIICNKKN